MGKWLKGIISVEQVVVVKKGAVKPNELLNAKIIIVSYEIAAKLTK